MTNATGQPVRGLRVTAFDGAHSASSTTDGSGAYTLKPLKPGTYAVSRRPAPRGSAAVNENARTVDLVTGVCRPLGTVGKGDAIVALLRGGKAVSTVDRRRDRRLPLPRDQGRAPTHWSPTRRRPDVRAAP